MLLLTLLPAAHAQYSPPPPYYGTNPSLSDIKAMMIKYGQKYQVPPHILFGIAQQESNWRQFNASDGGRTVYHLEPTGKVGVGIMQITVFPTDPNYKQLCIDIDYNIQRGAAYLADATNPLSCWNNSPIIGDNDRAKLENWFYAIWTYNGLDATIISRAYPDAVLYQIANCANGEWVDVTVTAPTVAQTTGHHTIPNTPSPYHVDANFDGVIDGSTGGFDPANPYVDTNYTGTEVGTASQPFRTIAAGVTAASTTQAVTLHIAPGWYKEKITITRNIHMVTNGSGTVRIGG